MLTLTTPFCLLVAQLCAVWAGTYEGYLANLLARNEAAQEEFRRNNPSGQFVLNYLDSPQFRRFQPLLTEDETVDTDADAWKAFLADLAYVADAAAKEDPEASAQHLSLAPWTKRPQLNDTPRSAELPVQNHLWGEHRVSGGSSEVGKWVDYAVLGAHAQDDDEEEEEEEGEGVFSGDSADAAHLPDTPFPTYASILTRPAAQTPSGVKLDQLPAYCDPPNPCPIGYDPESLATPCDRNIPNTKEFNRAWIMRKMQNGECPCDEEHMEACPAEKPAFPSASGFLKSVLLHNMDEDNPYLRGRRRASLVAKKFSHQQRRSKARFNPAQRFRLDSNFLGRHRNIVKKDGRRGAKQASSR